MKFMTAALAPIAVLAALFVIAAPLSAQSDDDGGTEGLSRPPVADAGPLSAWFPALPPLPAGLQFELGAGSISLISPIPPWLIHTSSPVVNRFVALHAGMASDRSYIDIDLSPYLGGDASTFILDARAGTWLRREAVDEEDFFITRLSSWFYATVTSFKSVASNASVGFSGSGFLNTGVGFTGEVGLNALGFAKLLAGAYWSYGVLLPTVGIMDFGLTTDVEVPIGRTGLEIYGHFVLWKNVMDYATLQGGLRYRLP